ncbi:glycosyltransferase family 1 protein [Sphingomonas sp.]|jgi:glycosyltransferase involved in cell wall biosynthesis|uniref:glycosyltransferase family 4 protein n=1 Tax=Sphingomonas sp. TaxID=28214 RepID=UPI002604A066|nr:glycosyltransferase family 1 protein [Sphingomonas sp.]MDF2605463.1 alpha-mannosyltransferase [Sphingomonas sp.]
MKIAIVTDAWAPQVNGVVRTLQSLVGELTTMGHHPLIIAPDGFRSFPCPTYPEIRLALASPRAVGSRIAAFGAEAIHIATEGPLGLAARRWCLDRGMRFTTAYHTQFPDYVAARTGLSPAWVWHLVRRFHQRADAVLVSTPTIQHMLASHGISHTLPWGRGVAREFTPDGATDQYLAALPRPLLLYVGRVAIEKNVAAFLAAPHPGNKVVVGDGPALPDLRHRFPNAHFCGPRFGEALAACYRTADVLVFPSRTDTFGLVMIEALACGTPVAAYPVSGPIDVLSSASGVMDDDLTRAIAGALTLDRARCAAEGRRHSWRASAEQFLAALVPIALPRAA